MTTQQFRQVKTVAKTQRAAVWSAPVMLVMFAVGFLVFARFVPPPSPAISAEAMANIFRSRRLPILIGMTMTAAGSALLAPFVAVISVHLRRIEGKWGVLAPTQLALGAILILEFAIPLMILEVPAFRPDLPVSTIRALSDLGFIIFIGLAWTAVLQILVIGVAILQDCHDAPIFPRWAGYFSLALAPCWAGGTFLVFVKSGPFAWNGLLSFWLPCVSFGVWVPIMTVLLLKAVNRQEEEAIAALSACASGDEPFDVHLAVEELRSELADLRGEVQRAAAEAR